MKSAEAAVYAGVAVSTIKRWADEGLVQCVRTAGGHRRYKVSDIDQRIARENHAEVDRWIEVLKSGAADEVDVALHLARRRLGSWWAVAQELGEAVVALGQRWERGEVTIAEEHRATERLRRGLASVCDRMVAADSAVAAVTCVPGDPHTLGLSLVELCLREVGYEVWWVGANLPAHDVCRVIQQHDVRVLAVSASAASNDREALKAFAELVAPATQDRGTHLALGGAGAWPDGVGFRPASWQEFSRWARSALGGR